ncbi:hypothetical protein H1Z61_14745 [Bacillus aquiflavi]|uniref:Uncharacterized protein n=1 Tax=Bacillus aquiflavi TaxID=2672567 RepID=A0A6B3W1X0_9BACI|nr:hypothetical protein [Bacillus aquiflavi]MBA4538357.1 hypothetical protein [Bacillus aquiflavi]NEY82705.1 hypothetical protein [Bacillus aquiflavi]
MSKKIIGLTFTLLVIFSFTIYQSVSSKNTVKSVQAEDLKIVSKERAENDYLDSTYRPVVNSQPAAKIEQEPNVEKSIEQKEQPIKVAATKKTEQVPQTKVEKRSEPATPLTVINEDTQKEVKQIENKQIENKQTEDQEKIDKGNDIYIERDIQKLANHSHYSYTKEQLLQEFGHNYTELIGAKHNNTLWRFHIGAVEDYKYELEYDTVDREALLSDRVKYFITFHFAADGESIAYISGYYKDVYGVVHEYGVFQDGSMKDLSSHGQYFE